MNDNTSILPEDWANAALTAMENAMENMENTIFTPNLTVTQKKPKTIFVSTPTNKDSFIYDVWTKCAADHDESYEASTVQEALNVYYGSDGVVRLEDDEYRDEILQLKKELQYQKEQTEYWRREAEDANSHLHHPYGFRKRIQDT
jgi:hypothetical protein